jgi:hypothetical protein
LEPINGIAFHYASVLFPNYKTINAADKKLAIAADNHYFQYKSIFTISIYDLLDLNNALSYQHD